MDSLEQQAIIQKVLTDYAAIPYANLQLKTQTIFDLKNNHYLLVNVGWQGQQYIYNCIVHIDIIDDKVWIQRDNTEAGIALDLEEAGILPEQIVLGFREPELRQHTGYAVA
ncbi:element excision factor XisI family protein [Coleofasciculus sp. E2-BRE-01]|uniref:element excision factor XisI family protein n=1 Tax=Coleofasciculus sp. E2-BRE-01 TaxID=3069524 RepID=UPI0032FCF840